MPNILPSVEFDIETGVKQGGILSPFLFNTFIDDLIDECLDKNLGAQYENLNVSIIVYADDVLLISPVDTHLKILLDICGNYGTKWRLKFNPIRTNISTFGQPLFSSKFYLNASILEEKDSISLKI